MDLEDLYNIISDKETVLEARLKMLVEMEASSENGASSSNQDFIVTALKTSIQSLQADIAELSAELMKRMRENASPKQSEVKKEGSENFNMRYNLIFGILLFLIYNAPEKQVCNYFGQDNRCSGGLFNDGRRRFWDCFYWFAINSQYALLSIIFWSIWRFFTNIIVKPTTSKEQKREKEE
jgi:hypothetical protein